MLRTPRSFARLIVTRSTMAMAALAPAGIGALSGCAKEIRSEEITLAAPAAPGSLTIDAETFRGDVTVRVRPSLKDTGVGYTVRAASDLDDADKPEVDRAVKVTAVVEDRGGAPTLVVRAVSERIGEDHRADIVIETASCDGVRAHTGGGKIVLVGVKGTIGADSAAGPITVRTNEALTAPVTLTTADGNIRYQAPVDSTGSFDAKSENGEAHWKAPEALSLNGPVTVGQGWFKITLGRGENPVTLRTLRGDIRVALMEDAQSLVRGSN